MRAFQCCGGTLAALSRAAAKSAGSRLRRLGLLREAADWASRASICESCPLRVIHHGTSYCGKPFMDKPAREVAQEGCGCPTIPKAKAPGEHCPLDWRNRPAQDLPEGCTCKWCNGY